VLVAGAAEVTAGAGGGLSVTVRGAGSTATAPSRQSLSEPPGRWHRGVFAAAGGAAADRTGAGGDDSAGRLVGCTAEDGKGDAADWRDSFVAASGLAAFGAAAWLVARDVSVAFDPSALRAASATRSVN
jgi:hypothetical protein